MRTSISLLLIQTLILVQTNTALSEGCGGIPDIQGGQYNCTDGFLDGSTCSFTCQIHYTLIGPDTLVCSLGLWDNPVPSCTPNDGAIRIQSVSQNKGTLEIYYLGWGSISHDGFTDKSATVACKQLGLGNVGLTYRGAYFGPSPSGITWLSDVSCYGNESDIMSCPNSGLAAQETPSFLDVGIECLDEYEYRLDNGPTPNSGRVEIKADGNWVGICDGQFDIAAANVTCNFLGYSGATDYHSAGEFNSGPIGKHYFNINCTGGEASLSECKHEVGDGGVCPLGSVGAGVTCRGGGVRLVGQANDEGVIEIYHAGKWGLIDDYGITDITAKVVCNILGFGYIGYKMNFYEAPTNIPLLLYSMGCLGNETDIVECPHSGWIQTNALYSYGSGVVCRPFDITSIRLVGGTYPFEGRVEIQVEGIWGTICDDVWDIEDAHVVCRMLGYSEAEESYRNAYYGEGTGYILADDVECQGHETNLDQCSFLRGQNSHNCIHLEDASVKCRVNARCFQQWIRPATSKFPMVTSFNPQTNFTAIESTHTLSDMRCVRKCNAHARQNCGQFRECKMAKFDFLTGLCTLYHRESVNYTIPCDGLSPCFLAMK